MAKAISKNKTIKVIDLSENKIKPQGVKHSANALKENNTLQSLYLSGNNIGDEGAEYIANMLAVNKTLQKISLNNINITNKGAQSLAASLVVSTGTRVVWLNGNKIGNSGAKKLLEALESNHNIETLDLVIGNYNISNSVWNRIKALCEKNRSIATLKQSIAKKDKKLEGKDTEIAKKDKEIELLKKESAKKDREIAKISRDNAKKDNRIATLEGAIRGQLYQLETIIDPVDLTSEDDNEPPNKRARTEDTTKSALAIQHEQNKKHTQRLVKIKQEKSDAETTLENVRVEKQAVESNLNETRTDLEDVREDLDIANETVTQVAVFTDRWQSKFDDMKALAEANGADGAAIAAIRDR